MLRVEALSAERGGAPLTFEIASGRTVGVLGRDAASLERIAECIAGIRAPIAGRVTLDGTDTWSDATRQAIAMNLSRTAHPLTSLSEHLGVVARARRSIRTQPAEAIARLGVHSHRRLDTRESRSAAGLLSALVPDVALVVLHEPFKDLSPTARANAIDWIRSLADASTSILVTGAEERDVRSVSHSVVEFGAGR